MPTARKEARPPAARPKTPQQRIDLLERELDDARRRIDDLEVRQRQIADRIAWALDSLRDLMDDDG